MKRLLLAALFLCATSRLSYGLTTYYMDPDASGANTGTSASPWQGFGSTQWTTINATLASDDVTVYFTARKAASDTDQTWASSILLDRTDTSAHRLTLDGMSQYNTSTSSPAWDTYSGTSRFHVTSTNCINTDNPTPSTTIRYRITVRGFKLTSTDGKIALIQTSDGIIFEYNQLEHAVTTTQGPGLLVGQSSDTAAYVNNLIIRNNTINKTWGEGIYISGNHAGQDPPGINQASNDNIVIENNTVIDAGWFGAQGDGIDVKDGNTNLTIRGNEIYRTASNPGTTDVQCIVLASGSLVERNFCHDYAKSGIVTGGAYLNQFGRTGLIVRNNLIVNVATASGSGILLGGPTVGNEAYKWDQTTVYNNTIYKTTGGTGIANGTNHDNITVKNNLVFMPDANRPFDFPTAGKLAAHDYNLYYKTSGTLVFNNAGVQCTCSTITTCEAHSKCVDPLFVDRTTTPYVSTNFKLQSGSTAIDAGTDLSATFTNDFNGVLRPFGAAWDMGAFEFLSATGAVPTLLRIIK